MRGALQIWEDVANGLSFLHRHGLYYLDVKHDNIVIGPNGHAKLVDFDTVHAADSHLSGPVGSPRFIAPEVLSQPFAVSPAADVFSLGVLMYEMVFARFPYPPALFWFDANGSPRVLIQNQSGRRQWAPDFGRRWGDLNFQNVPPCLSSLIGGALAPNRGARLQDAEDLLLEIDGARRGLDGARLLDSLTHRPSSRRKPDPEGTIKVFAPDERIILLGCREFHVLYPHYFDQARPRSIRRVPARLAVSKPRVREIAKVAKKLGLDPVIEEGRALPARPWERDGRVLVAARDVKSSVLRRVAIGLLAMRRG